MSLTRVSFSIRNNHSDTEVNDSRSHFRVPESNFSRRKEIDNSIGMTVYSEVLPTPQARGGRVKSKKIPPQNKPGNSFLSSSKKTSVIYSRTKNASWGRSSARRISDKKNEPGRESMMSARSDVFGVLKNSAVEIQRKDKKNTACINSVPDPVPGQGVLENLKNKTIVAEKKQDRTRNDQLSYPVERVIPFITPESALLSILNARFRDEKIYFSVPHDYSPSFELHYSFPINNAIIKDGDIVFFQAFCEESLEANSVNDPSSLLESDNRVGIYSAMTISAMSQDKLKMLDVPSSKLLPPNSFKLVEYQDRHKNSNLLIVWHRHKPQSAGGSRAVITEISTEQGNYQLIDKNSGYHFKSNNLNDFIAGVERVSGLTYSDEKSPHHQRGTLLRHEISMNMERNFFIEANKTSASPVAMLELSIDEGDDLFSSFDAVNKSEGKLIYRGSFKFEGDVLRYIDMEGNYNGVNFKKHPRNPSLLQIDDDGSTVMFLRGKGVLKGFFYSKKEISEMLSDYNYTNMNNSSNPSSKEPRLDNFYITSV